MSNAFIGEIRIFAGTFAPVGWNFCDGSLLQIAQFDAMFNLLGTTFGGDGQTTFGVPDLRGRAPIHRSGSMIVGETAGSESVTLTVGQLAAHDHAFQATTAGATQPTPGGNVPAQSSSVQLFTEDSPAAPMAPVALLPAPGGGQAHDNMHPFQTITYIIATEGIYPSPS